MDKISCEKILYLLPSYTDGKISKELACQIEQHLSVCDDCFEKYIKLKNISQKIQQSLKNTDFRQKQEEFFKENISAYIDNELSKDDYFYFSGYVSSNSQAKKELDEMIKFEENLKKNIEKNKQTLEKDLSEDITEQIRRENPLYVSEIFVTAGILTVVFVLLTVLAGYFSIPDNWEAFAAKAHIVK